MYRRCRLGATARAQLLFDFLERYVALAAATGLAATLAGSPALAQDSPHLVPPPATDAISGLRHLLELCRPSAGHLPSPGAR